MNLEHNRGKSSEGERKEKEEGVKERWFLTIWNMDKMVELRDPSHPNVWICPNYVCPWKQSEPKSVVCEYHHPPHDHTDSETYSAFT